MGQKWPKRVKNHEKSSMSQSSRISTRNSKKVILAQKDPWLRRYERKKLGPCRGFQWRQNPKSRWFSKKSRMLKKVKKVEKSQKSQKSPKKSKISENVENSRKSSKKVDIPEDYEYNSNGMKKSFVFILVLGIFAAFVFTACGANVFDATGDTEETVYFDEADEKQRFIDATVEMTCMLMKADNLSEYLSSENRPDVNRKLDEIYSRYGFDVEDSEKMEDLAKKYEDDDEVFEEVQLGLLEC